MPLFQIIFRENSFTQITLCEFGTGIAITYVLLAK